MPFSVSSRLETRVCHFPIVLLDRSVLEYSFLYLFAVGANFQTIFPMTVIQDLTRVVISYDIYETSLRRIS